MPKPRRVQSQREGDRNRVGARSLTCRTEARTQGASVPERVGSLAWFKTGKGQYSEHDRFIGVGVPMLRTIAAKYRRLKFGDIEALLGSRIHEHRYAALLILVAWYEEGNSAVRQEVFDFYINHRQGINNWDLVDTSAPYIVGEHLVSRSRRILYSLADSPELWDRRIAMVATSAFIQRGDLKDTFAIAKRLLADRHDLIHKADRLDAAGSRSALARRNDRLFEAQLFADSAHQSAVRY